MADLLFTPKTQTFPKQGGNKLDEMISIVAQLIQQRDQAADREFQSGQRARLLQAQTQEDADEALARQGLITNYGKDAEEVLNLGVSTKTAGNILQQKFTQEFSGEPFTLADLAANSEKLDPQSTPRLLTMATDYVPEGQVFSPIRNALFQNEYKNYNEYTSALEEANLDPKSYKQYWDEWQEERRRLLSGSGSGASGDKAGEAEDTVYNASILQAQAPGVNAANLSKQVVGEAAAELTAANKELSNLKATLNPRVTNIYNFAKNPDGALVFTAKNNPGVKYALTANGNFFRYSVSKNIFEPADIMDKLVINKIMTPEERKDLRGTYNKYIQYVEAYNRRDTIIKAATAAGQNPYDLKTKDYYK